MSLIEEAKTAAGDSLRVLGTCIVVVDNGFVQVGDVYIAGGEVLISNNRNLRIWGTDKGLGQLISGPRKETVADWEGETIVPYGRVVKIIPVDAKKWAPNARNS